MARRGRSASSDSSGSFRLRGACGAGAIAIRSAGLPRLITRFQGTATADGRLAVDRPPEPSHYEAHYDLRKSRDRYLNMPFAKRTGFCARFSPRAAIAALRRL